MQPGARYARTDMRMNWSWRPSAPQGSCLDRSMSEESRSCRWSWAWSTASDPASKRSRVLA